MKDVPLSEVKDDLSRFLREAETQEIVITRHGKPAGVLIGFELELSASDVFAIDATDRGKDGVGVGRVRLPDAIHGVRVS
jgi:prevent-host-death family protein